MALRIIFMGTPQFAVPALQSLHQAGHDIIAVYTQPPRPKGRGQQVQNSPVHAYAEANRIPVYHPKSLKNAEAQSEFASLKADVAVVAAYGLILPKAVLDAPKHGCINIHASILPRWRGASPIQHAILSGDAESGVTLMQMDEGLDTGAILAIEKTPLTGTTTTPELHDTLSAIGGRMIVKAMNDLAQNGKLPSTPQDDSETVYAPMLKKEDGKLNWKLSAKILDQKIRALNPWPGTFADYEGKRIKILEAIPQKSSAVADKQTEGTILDKSGAVLCGDGSVLQITKLQPDGKKPMDFTAALNGTVKVGGVFA
jgi:methionyl-tRNA formyltransferase